MNPLYAIDWYAFAAAVENIFVCTIAAFAGMVFIDWLMNVWDDDNYE